MESKLILNISQSDIRKIEAIRIHCAQLLDTSHRFKYFTLHGTTHIDNLFKILDLFVEAGLKLTEKEVFLLSCAICVHDIGMVTPLSDLSISDVFGGIPQPPDPSRIENYIRAVHHNLVDLYLEEHFSFLSDLGVDLHQISIIKEISKCHRKENLLDKHGYVAKLGALLRVLDELDIYASRAPLAVFRREYADMDATSCWHWLKHNISEDWMIGHNVLFESSVVNRIIFKIAVHPPTDKSITYWLNNIIKPIHRELIDEGAGKIIIESFGLQVVVQQSQDLSGPVNINEIEEIEQKALSSGRKVILVVDDEVRKMEDLFIQLMDEFHIIFSPNIKDAFSKLSAINVDLVIVDLQIGSGGLWGCVETEDFKMTGLKFINEIRQAYPQTKSAVLTGSRHDLTEVMALGDLAFFLRKPIDPDRFTKEVSNVLK